MNNLESHLVAGSGATRSRRSGFADKAALALVGIACSAVIGGAFWLVNRQSILEDGRLITILALFAYGVYARMRINRLESKLKELGHGEDVFAAFRDSSPKDSIK